MSTCRLVSTLGFCAALFLATPAFAQTCTEWNLARDYRTAPALNPNPDACGQPVWEFLYSPTRARDPGAYVRIPTYAPFHGAGAWQVTDPVYYYDTYAYLPAVALNSSGTELQVPFWAPFPWTAGTTLVHPGPDQPAVVSFRSPVAGTLEITASFTSLDFYGGDGVDVTVDSDVTNFFSGIATYGHPLSFSAQIAVRAGDSLYFTVGPNGNLYYDSTRVDIDVKLADTEVPVDIRPGTYPNPINLGSNGVVPIAILSTGSFDARNVDPTSVTLAGAAIALRGNGTPAATLEDVNGDGLVDLVVQVETQALTLASTDVTATVTGRLSDGTTFHGSDTVRIVP